MAEYVCEVMERPAGKPIMILARRECVTRCIDCAHAAPCPFADSEKLICSLHDEMLVNPDGFCAWGEPKGSDADD